jgi:hypothetical protein
MKATIDIPDSLYRQVKARSAMEGRAVRDVTIALYRNWLGEAGERPNGSDAKGDVAETWLSTWETLAGAVHDAAVDERTTREIVTSDRR